jgi:hypothetical protein
MLVTDAECMYKNTNKRKKPEFHLDHLLFLRFVSLTHLRGAQKVTEEVSR